MKNRVTWITCLVLLSFIVNAQKIALIGGPATANVLEKNNLSGWESNTKPHYTSRTGLHIGFIADIPMESNNKWFFQPGIIYQSKGRKFFQSYDSATALITDTLMSRKNALLNYIEFPLNAAYKFSVGQNAQLVISGGPYFSLFYGGKEIYQTKLYASNDFREDEEKVGTGRQLNKVNTVDIGWNSRVGMETRTIFFSFFYSRGLSNFYHERYDGSFKHRVAGASLGFWLNKVKPVTKPPKDSDHDGIPDALDECPAIMGNEITKGCPDQDGDGIADEKDKCPGTVGTTKFEGCPIPDTDKDGINDEEDKCPEIPGTSTYLGCPVPDSDGDGVKDDVDNCPDKQGTLELNGCPIPDTDNDGVNDKEDKCPLEPGSTSNNGCPDIRQQIVEKVNLAARNIFYDRGSDKLSPKSFEALDEIATLLKNNATLKLEIEGHTDNTGEARINRVLSQKRANAVKKYLVDVGIRSSRIKATGFGSQKPLAADDTEEGRSQNRRVDLKLVE